MGFDINPGTIGRIRQKVACFASIYLVEIFAEQQRPSNGSKMGSSDFDNFVDEIARVDPNFVFWNFRVVEKFSRHQKKSQRANERTKSKITLPAAAW